MPKLAIYIPKKQMREIERWRKQINFSQVFVRALEREIRERSRAVPAGDDQVVAAAEYYRRRLAENSDLLVDAGYQLGSQHVMGCKLGPDAIRRLLATGDEDQLGPEEMSVIEQEIAGIAGEEKSIVQLLESLGYDEQVHPTCRAEVYRGYVKGLRAAWTAVCAQMKQ